MLGGREGCRERGRGGKRFNWIPHGQQSSYRGHVHHGGTCSCMPCSTILKPLLFNILVVLEDDERVIGEEVELGNVEGEAGSDG